MGEWGCLGWRGRQSLMSVWEEGRHSKATLDLNSGTKVQLWPSAWVSFLVNPALHARPFSLRFPRVWRGLTLGKTEGKRSGWQSVRCLDSIANSMNMNWNKLLETVEKGGA